MENSKQFLKDNQILPKISFKDGKERTVKIIGDKSESFENEKGEIVNGMKYKVLENGEVKTIFTASVSLITKLAEVQIDTVVKIKYRKYKSADGFRATYDVNVVDGAVEEDVSEDPMEDIPTIEDDIPAGG